MTAYRNVHRPKRFSWNRMLAIELLLFFIAITFSFGKFEMVEGSGGGGNIITQNFMLIKFVIFAGISYCGVFLLARSEDAWRVFCRILTPHLYVLLYMGLALVFLPIAAKPGYSLFKWGVFVYSYAALVFLLVQYALVYKDRAREQLFKHLLMVFFCTILLPMTAIVMNGPGVFFANFRAKVGNGALHPNIMAALFTYGFLFGLFYPGLQPRDHQYSYIEKMARKVIVFVFPLLIMLTFSRGALVAIIMGAGVAIFLLSFWYKNRLLALIQIGGITLLVGFVLCLMTGIIPLDKILSSVSRLESGADLYTLTGRTELWKFVFQQFTPKSLLTGNGYAVMAGDVSFSISHGKLYGAHNSYIMVLASMGLCGLTCFLAFLFTCIWRVKRASRYLGVGNVAYFLVLVLVFMSHSIVDSFFGLNLGGVFSILLISFTFPLYQEGIEYG